MTDSGGLKNTMIDEESQTGLEFFGKVFYEGVFKIRQ